MSQRFRRREKRAMVDNRRMIDEAEPTVPPDKKTLRRQLRAQRRSSAPQRERRADADAIAAAAGALLDTLSPQLSGTGEHSAYGGEPGVAVYPSLPGAPPPPAPAPLLPARP